MRALNVITRFSAIFSVILTAGCTTHSWAPGPDARGTFEEAKAQCSLMARHSGGAFYAAGRPGFVAGAAAGAAVGDAIRAQNDFNDCMAASGWVVADLKKGAPKVTKETVASMRSDLNSCIEGVRNDPKFASVISHIRRNESGRFSLTQMSDETYPNIEESALLASLGDGEDVCREKTLTQIAALSPGSAQALRQTNARARDLELQLIARKITWGGYAKYAQDMLDQIASRSGAGQH